MPEQTAASILLAALTELSRRVDGIHDGLGEIKREIVALGMTGQRAIDQYAHVDNRVTKLEQRADEHDEWHVVAETTIRARKEQRQDDLEAVNRFRQIVGDWLPYVIGAGGGLLFVLSWDVWPW